jgi:enoyl-CoA hydratase/carnithine racemase
MGHDRALEVLLSANDYDAELAERYGWINRALPADALEVFVTRLARRIAAFPAAGHVAVKDRVNASRSRRPRSSAAIRICSAMSWAAAIAKRGPQPRSTAASRLRSEMDFAILPKESHTVSVEHE